MHFEWEIISEERSGTQAEIFRRARIHGGWIVNSIYIDTEWRINECDITFIPDERHEWKIDKKTITISDPLKGKNSSLEKCKKKRK